MSEAAHAAILRWLAASTPARITVSCAEAALPGTVVLDGCLADAPLAWLAELAGHAPVQVAADACATPEATRSRLQELAQLTSRITLDGGPTQAATVRYASPPARRRGLLGLGRTAPGPSGTHQQRLAAALAALPVDPDAPSPAARLTVTDACTACGVCVRGCPHDALELAVADGVATLTQLADSCQADHACVALCPHDAIHAADRLRWAEVREHPRGGLIAMAVRTCATCQTPFPASTPGTLCPLCREREADPFGVHLPPAARALLERRRRRRGLS